MSAEKLTQGEVFGQGGPRNRRPTPEQERGIIGSYLRGASMLDAAGKYGFCEKTCANVLRRNGVPSRPVGEPRQLTPEQEAEAIARYEGGETLAQVGAACDMSDTGILRVLRRHGKRARPNKVHHFDEGFFSSIDSDVKAYVLGFVSADGAVREGSSPGVMIQLQHRDRAHLIAIGAALQHPGKVRDYWTKPGRLVKTSRPMSYVAFHSRRLANDLARLGVIQNKSLVLEPWQGPAELMPAYFRGLIDGDGSWKRTRNGHYCALYGTRAVVGAFLAFVRDLTGDVKPAYPHGSIWVGKFTHHATLLELARTLYRGATLSLPRKRVVAEEVIARQGGARTLYRSHRHLTAEALLALYDRHRQWIKVAAALRMSPHDLYALVHRRGVRMPQGRHDLTAERLLALREQCGSWGEVAKAVGVLRSSLRRIRRKRGLPIGQD